MIEHVIERSVRVGQTLQSLHQAVEQLIAEGQPEWSEFRVADRSNVRTLTGRWRVEQCWADGCERLGVRTILPNEWDDPFAKFCEQHDWSDVEDDEE